MIQGWGGCRANEGESWWVRGFPRDRSARAPRLRAQAPGSTRGADDAPLWRRSVAAHVPGPRPADPRTDPARPTGRRAEPECGGARAEPSRADGPEVGPLRFLPAARREGSAPAAAVCACASSRAPGGPRGGGGRRASESLSRTGSAARGTAWAEAASFPCALPAPPPCRCRQRSGPGARAIFGVRGLRCPAFPWSGGSLSAGPLCPWSQLGGLRRYSNTVYFSEWVVVTGRK